LPDIESKQASKKEGKKERKRIVERGNSRKEERK